MNNPALLTYAFATYPSPIQTSTAQSPLNAAINIGVISPAGQDIYCSEISVIVPVGTGASSLTDGTVNSSLNNTMWTIISDDPERRAALKLAADTYLVTFEAKDQSAWLINYNLVLGLAAQVNTVVGDFTVKVIETSGTSPDNLTRKDPAFFTLSKETPQFYLQSLVATAVGSPFIPATEFPSGQPFTLAWDSNGTFFQIYEKGNPTPIYAGMQASWTIQLGVQTDTTFFLVAMMTSNPTGDDPPPSFAPIYLYDALTVTISNPNLTPSSVVASSLNVNGPSTLNGPTTIGASGASDPFVVNLGTELKTTLQVDGNVNLNSLTVPGTTNLEGQTNLTNVAMSGIVTVNGPTNPGGGLTIWGGPQTEKTPTPSHFDARNNYLYMGWMPVIDEAQITFKLSDNSGMLGYNGSSRKFKKDIQDFSDDFHKILKAQPVSFVFKGSEDSPRSIGYIAEDFHDLGLHQLLVYNKEGEPLLIKYDRLALYQLEIIKELMRDVESLKEKLNAVLKQETQKRPPEHEQ